MQVLRFDVLKGSNSAAFDARQRAALDAALRAEYAKAPTQLPAAPSRTRQVKHTSSANTTIEHCSHSFCH
jgi:hypothetical protein